MADDATTPTAFDHPIPVCPVRGSVLFPTMVMPIDAGRPVSIRAINAALDRDRTILIVSQRDRDIEEPGPKDLYQVGTACHIMRMKKNPDGSIQMLVRAVARVRVDEYTADGGVIEADVHPFEVPDGDPVLLEAAFRELKEKFGDLVEHGGRGLQAEVAQFVLNLEDPGQFADYVAYHLDFKVGDKQAVLEAPSVADRLKKALVLLDTELELQETQRRLQREVKDEIDRNQREYFLREQIKALQKELSGSDDEEDEVEAFREKLEALGLPEPVMKEANRELNRMSRMHPDSAEASVIRTYLTTLTELPWNVRSEDRLDVEAAETVLEEDHYGLEKVKDRVLEYLAVRKLKSERAAKGEIDPGEIRKGPILLFVGPPGVGKTSIAKSIAKALGREYVRISLGGARDESDIRGHRRTYIGSMPGRIIQGIRQAGTKNPVFLLDEVDKLGVSYQGDPSSALLEVLDPAQNNAFVDHYLGVPFDLSEVLFVATANYAQQIPEPLYDRMEPIEFSSYVELEKQEIAKRYLLPRQLPENGLKGNQFTITDGALSRVISAYTREAGVRQLERTIGTLVRKAARKIADGDAKRVRLTERSLEGYLGAERFTPESENEEDLVGVATGMYYTPVGGDILFVETSVTKGKSGLRAHRAARRRHEGVRTRRAHVRQGERRSLRHRPRVARRLRDPHPRPLGRHPQGGTERRHRARDLADQRADRRAGAPRRRDDRRGHAAWSGTADRRPAREDPRRQARRHPARDLPGEEPGRHEGHRGAHEEVALAPRGRGPRPGARDRARRRPRGARAQGADGQARHAPQQGGGGRRASLIPTPSPSPRCRPSGTAGLLCTARYPERMRTPLIAGNWKLHTTPSEAVTWARAFLEDLAADPVSGVDLALHVPFTHLAPLAPVLRGTAVALGAQDVSVHADGAHTGEVSAAMLVDAGATTVVVGHSERRADHAETDAIVHAKAAAALAARLVPVVCVGEVEADRAAGRHKDVVVAQLRGSLTGLDAPRSGRPGGRLRARLGDRHRTHGHARRRPGDVGARARGPVGGLRRPGRQRPRALRRQHEARQRRRAPGHARRGRRSGGRREPRSRLAARHRSCRGRVSGVPEIAERLEALRARAEELGGDAAVALRAR